MGKSYSSVVQEDTSVKTGGDAQNVLGQGASQVSASDSLLITAPNTTLGDITMNQFPEAVQDTVKNLVGAVESTVQGLSDVKAATVEGDIGQYSKMILYLVIGVSVVLIGRQFLK